MLSASEIENTFFSHAADVGVVFSQRPLCADGVLHRAHVEGDKRGTKNAAYVLHADGNPSGWFQHFSSGTAGKWTLSGKREPLSKAAREQIEADRQRRLIEQEQRYINAASKSRFIWMNSKPLIEHGQHPYLIKKLIKPYQLRLYRDALVIPIYDEHRQLVNLQFIAADGSKRFLSGGKKKWCFAVIGKPETGKPLQICEGWATGASLFEATSLFTVVALDAGNLEPVALVMRRLFPDSLILLMGDNDANGTGQKAAQAAAVAVDGKCIIPTTVGYDWNDALTLGVPRA
jgi:putative DNA primase/helicase